MNFNVAIMSLEVIVVGEVTEREDLAEQPQPTQLVVNGPIVFGEQVLEHLLNFCLE
jgi:hypothetical protein